MDLKKLTHQDCPICGSEIIAEKRYSKHTNGHWNEEQEFECGHRVRFSPNFMREHTVIECQKDPKVIKRDNQRKHACGLLEKYIERLKVDDAYREKIKFSLSQYLPNYRYEI